MRFYICSSTDNLPAVYYLRDELKSMGHYVFDWTQFLPPLGRVRGAAGPEGYSYPVRLQGEIKERKDDDPGKHIYTFCRECCALADMVLYLGRAGQDAGFELGVADTVGVPIWAVFHERERPGAMVKGAVQRTFPTIEALLTRITDLNRKWWVQ